MTQAQKKVNKMKIKKGDKVIVLTGKDKGKTKAIKIVSDDKIQLIESKGKPALTLVRK